MTTTTSKHPLKHNLAALLFAAASIAVTLGTAQAITLDIGELLADGPVTLSRFFSKSTSFVDVFNFTLAAPAIASFDLSSSGIAALTLLAPDGTTLVGPGGSLLTDHLAGGPYSASLMGTASAGGTYEITLNAVAAPEPAGWMLIAAGLVAVGLIARRRVKSVE